MEKESIKLKAFVVGASGASGRELVDYLIHSKEWSEITIISRRKLDRWNNLPLSDCSIKFVIVDNLDIMGEPKDKILKLYPELNLEGYTSVFCCLGSRVKHGEEEFRKVDQTYPLYAASLCEKFNINHYSIISSEGSDPKSCFLYMRVKGETEVKLQTMNIKNISIFRPGAILNRDNDSRCGESFLKCFSFLCCCCLSSIECTHLSWAVGYEAEKTASNGFKGTQNIYKNCEIESLYKESIKDKK